MCDHLKVSKMNFFLDTNVLLGYIFETDKWNSKSLEVVNHKTPKYSSYYAREECASNYGKKIRRVLNELRKFGKRIRVSNSLAEVELYLHEECTLTGDIILEFLKLNKEISLSELIRKFREFQMKAESRCYENYNYILKYIIFHNRSFHHRELYNKCISCGFVPADADDVEIIIDAHDLGLKIKSLFFITGDYTHIISRKDFILENTSIYDIIGLGEFNFT